MKYIIVLEIGKSNGTGWVFIAPWPGDPGRSIMHENAKRYDSIRSATYGLAHARKYNDFSEAKIIEVEQ